MIAYVKYSKSLKYLIGVAQLYGNTVWENRIILVHGAKTVKGGGRYRLVMECIDHTGKIAVRDFNGNVTSFQMYQRLDPTPLGVPIEIGAFR